MTDPIAELFGVSARELFEGKGFVVSHGSLSRFPVFMRQGLLASIDSLCRQYEGPLEVANGTAAFGVQTAVAGAHPVALLRLGLTVFFCDLKGVVAGAREWLKQLETSLGVPECAGFMAFANSVGSGLPVHHDQWDQLLFQIVGEKQFYYAPNRFAQNPSLSFSPAAAAPADFAASYRSGFPLTSEEILADLQTVTLRPGSALFMPNGTWHTTAGQAGDCLSLVVAVRAPTHLDLLENLLHQYARQSPAWRAPCYGGWSHETAVSVQSAANLDLLMADLGKRFKHLSAADAYKAWSAHAYTLGAQSEYPSNAQFARYIRLPNSSLTFESAEPEGQLRCTVRSGPTNRPQAQILLAVSVEARPVIEWVLRTNAAFTVEELAAQFPQFARASLELLLGWLSQSALLRPLVAEEWDSV